jgi:DNA-binding beta-propeller fold protein YncE
MIARRLTLVSAVALCTFVCGSALVASSASAAVTQFGEQGEGAGQFIEPRGIAVDQESGDVYMADRNNQRVEMFTKEGTFLLAWGWGVASGDAKQQTCGPEALPPSSTCSAGIEGGAAGQFDEPAGVAVDNSLGLSHGDVYVADTRNNRVEKFKPTGELELVFGGEVNKTKDETPGTSEAEKDLCTVASGDVCQAGVEGLGAGQFERPGMNAIAVDSTGTVYVGDNGRVQEFSEDGVLTGHISLANTGFIGGLVVDASKDVYLLSELSGVRKYSSSGTELWEREPSANPFDSVIALGPAGELFVDNESESHIDEFDASGNEVLSMPEEAQELGASVSLAFGDGIKQLYVLHQRAVLLAGLAPPGPVVFAGSESASEILPTTATLNATVNPEGHEESGHEESSYHFEYGETESYGTSTPPEISTGGSFEGRHVSVALSKLQPRTLYHFRVVVTNAAHETTDGPDEAFETLPPVSIDSESVSQVTSRSASLAAELNPLGLATEYRFEYGTSDSYGTSVPVPDGYAGAEMGDVSVSALIEGLMPGRTYHYRLLAHNALGVIEGLDRTFTTQLATTEVALPDGRAWEMVSPPAKQGVALEAFDHEGGLIQAAGNGSSLTYMAKAPIDADPAGNRTLAYQQLLAERGAAGWSTQDIATPNEAVAGIKGGKTSEYLLFSSDLSVGLVEPEGATPLSAATSEQTPYLRESGGEYTPLVVGCPPVGVACEPSVEGHADVPPGTKFGDVIDRGELQIDSGVRFVSASPNLGHVVLTATQSLAAGFTTGGDFALYEWNGGTPLRPVSVLPDGTSAATEGGASLGDQNVMVRNAISEDGTRVFFESANTEKHLFMRDMERDETVRLDMPEDGAKGGGVAAYQDANNDGSRVFFTDTAPLTDGATSNSLYACEFTKTAGPISCPLTNLTVPTKQGVHAEVQGAVIGASEDGSNVYFVATSILSETGNANHEKAKAGADNLYVQHYDGETREWQARFIAALSPMDAPDWAGASPNDLREVAARVSGNGRFIAFMSQESLTGYDNRDAVSGEPDEEVYLYDTTSGHTVCASCDPTGARPVGMLDHSEVESNGHGGFEVFLPPLVDRPELWAYHWLAGSVPGWTSIENGKALYQSRYLDNSGRLFFDSPVGLVAQDANGREDAYEFEPAGVGGCTSSTSTGSIVSVDEVAGSPVGGCVGLISSGSSSEESAFLDASGKGPGGEEGEDVFFMTEAKLSSADVDDALDVYDAHVCAALSPCPEVAVSAPPACTTADSCRAAPSPQPSIFGAPSSATFNGTGNVAPATAALAAKAKTKKTIRCAKPKKLSRGKCVKKQSKRPKSEKSKRSKKAERAGERRRVRS